MNHHIEKEKKECNGCKLCEPYDYTVEVHLQYLTTIKHALEYLKEKSPENFAQGWLDNTEKYIKNVTIKHHE